MRTVRALLGVTGVVLMAAGAWLLVFDTRDGTVPQVVLWLAGSVALHDFLLVPSVMLTGLVLLRIPGRAVWRCALLTGGALTLLALPLMLRGRSAGKPSLLPLDYTSNWALSLGATVLAAVCVLLARSSLTAWTGRRDRNGRS